MEAVQATEKHCTEKKISSDGVAQLRKLIKQKSLVSYGDQKITEEFAKTLAISSERFQAWANQVLKGLK